MEQFGAEVGAAHPLFKVLRTLHFGLPEVQTIAGERLMTTLFDGVFRSVVSKQPEGALRITLSLGREHETSYPFWNFLLGLWRPLPRLFDLPEAVVEVEMADRFAEYLAILPNQASPDSVRGREIRRAARDGVLDELLAFEELRELPEPNPRSSILERRLGASDSADTRGSEPSASEAMTAFGQDILSALQVDRFQLFEMSHIGLTRVASVGASLDQARIRRVFWLDGNATGAIEVARPGPDGHARIASLLDEHIDAIAYRFAELQKRAPLGLSGGGFAQAKAEVRDPTIGEPPPSSRGRVARAARDSRLRELAEKWQLTERQRDVLALLVEGLANKEIAARLDCSVGTIENHVTRLLKRAGVDCRAALTATFWRTSGR
jgi:DNA-binding CsgD family transcriptional regulator